jgi:hypothetical protein
LAPPRAGQVCCAKKAKTEVSYHFADQNTACLLPSFAKRAMRLAERFHFRARRALNGGRIQRTAQSAGQARLKKRRRKMLAAKVGSRSSGKELRPCVATSDCHCGFTASQWRETV